MSYEGRHFPQFYMTPQSACPYLPDRLERKVFTHLTGEAAGELNDILTHGGFRRSQNIAYRPACTTCSSCVSVRIVVDDFVPARSFKRIQRANRDVEAFVSAEGATQEQYSLFRDYIENRHGDGGMSDMTVLDFVAMVEESAIETVAIEYRLKPEFPLATPDPQRGSLIATALTDVLQDGLSMVYSFFAPEHAKRGLGTYMILEHVERARRLGLPYVYLGYWVEGSPKMDYKQRFRPQERLTPDGWQRVE